MGSLNQCTLIGNMVRDAEVRYTKDNKPIANITIETSEKWKDQSGQKQEKSEFHRVVIFGNLSDVVQKYLSKGSKLMVQGKLQTRKWTDQQGVEKYTTEVVVDRSGTMVMLGGVSKLDSRDVAHGNNQNMVNDQTEFTDDIPF